MQDLPVPGIDQFAKGCMAAPGCSHTAQTFWRKRPKNADQ